MLSTNYTLKDWAKLSQVILIKIVLPFLGTFFILFTLLIPMIDVMREFVPMIVNEEIALELVTHMRSEGINGQAFLLYYVFTVSGGVVIPVIILLWSMGRLLALGDWIGYRMKLVDPEFFWNGIPARDTEFMKKWFPKKTKL